MSYVDILTNSITHYNCPKCNAVFRVMNNELNFKQVDSRQKRLGLEIHYSATWRGKCSNCQELIEMQEDIWEYPEDHRNDSKITFVGYPPKEAPDLTKFMHAPLYDETGTNKMGTFTIEAEGNFKVRCTECDRVYDVNGEECVYGHSENEDAIKNSGTIFHAASWDCVCECGTELGIAHWVYSELHGIIYDKHFNEKNCEALSEPRLRVVKHTPG